MKIGKSKIQLAASEDGDRPVLRNVHYNPTEKRLEACDGYMLAVIPVEDGGEAEAFIPVEAIKAAQKLASKRYEEPTLTLADNQITPGKIRGTDDEVKATVNYQAGEFCSYPDTNQIIPKREYESFAFAIDAKKLWELAEAICEPGDYRIAVYHSPDKFAPISINPVEQDKRQNLGVLMPIDPHLIPGFKDGKNV